ncbi:MAG: CDP-archaeol synthase [Acidobacteriota bacterium]
MLQAVLETIWIFLPAMAANMAPVLAAHLPMLSHLKTPLDAGISWRGARLLGGNKTVRGLITGVLAGAVTGALQSFFYTIFPWVKDIALVSYEPLLFAGIFGATLGAGALGGDAAKSFIKRQAGVRPGQSLAILDQIDFVLGAAAVIYFFVTLTVLHLSIALVLIGIASFVTSGIGVAFGIKKSL